MTALSAPLDEMLGSKAKVRLLRLLLQSGGAMMSTREIARRTGMAKRTMDLALGDLAALGLLVREQAIAWTPYRVNLDHALISGVLRPLFEGESGYVGEQFAALRELIDTAWRGHASALYWGGIFGSVARGEEMTESDVDLAIIIDDKEQVPAVHERASMATVDFERRFGRRLSPLVMSREQFVRLFQLDDPLATSLVRDGRRLGGEADLEGLGRGAHR